MALTSIDWVVSENLENLEYSAGSSGYKGLPVVRFGFGDEGQDEMMGSKSRNTKAQEDAATVS